MPTTLILQASARPDGDTHHVATELARRLEADHLDLLDFTVHYFRYEQTYPADDQFLELVDIWLRYDRIVFASPVYWYSMSGYLKVFFDRISDLLMKHKDLGRQLRGRQLAVLAVSNDGVVEECFFGPFELSAGYLGMDYGPVWRGWVEGEVVKLEMGSNRR